MTSFAELGISEPVVKALAARGLTDAFAVQELAIPDAMAGRDVLVRSRTGSGKTLAFAIPVVERLNPNDPKPSAVVLVPTRELCSQVEEEFSDLARARGLRSAAVYGGVNISAQADKAERAQILIATPGRLEDLADRKLVDLSKVKVLILDEADRMLDMGFQPQVAQIVRRIPKERHTMFFSATLDGAVGNLARYYTKDPVVHELSSDTSTVDEADHEFHAVDAGGKVEKLIQILKQEDRELALVFVRTKHGADRLVQKLRKQGIHAEAMHGDMTQAAREKAFKRFEDEHINVLVATDVAARGLDLDNISHVVNFDPPHDDKGYLHRVGRTARAGRSGTGVTFVQPVEEGDVGRMAARLKLTKEFEAAGMSVPAPRSVFQSRGFKRTGGKKKRR